MTGREIRPFAITILIYLVPCLIGLFLVFAPTLLSGFGLMQVGTADTRHLNYVLEHSYQWLTGNALHASFWNPPLLWPTQNVAAYSEILLGVAPIYWIMRFLGFMPDTSFQLWTILVAALNYTVALVLLRVTLGISLIGSLGGAYFFAFAIARIAQLDHEHLLPQFYSLAAIIFLINGFRAWEHGEGSRRITLWLLAFGGAVVLQLYSSVYHGWFFAFGLVIFALIGLSQRTTRQAILGFAKANKPAIAATILFAAALLSWMGYHYFLAYRELGPRGWSEVASMVPRVTSWFYYGNSPVYSWLGAFIDFSLLPMRGEHVLGLGFVASILCCYGYYKSAGGNPWLRTLGISILAIFFLALLYPFGFSPWKLVWAAFPGASAIRAVTRIVLLLLIPVSVGVALGLQGIKNARVAVAVLAVLCLEQWYPTVSFDKFEVRRNVAAIAGSLSPECTSFYYSKISPGSPTGLGLPRSHVDAMWAGIAAGRPTLNGYTSNSPKQWHLWQTAVINSRVQGLEAEENVKEWAEFSGLKLNEICLPWLKKAEELPGFSPPLGLAVDGTLTLDFGSDLTRACIGSGWNEQEPNFGIWAEDKRARMFVPLQEGCGYKANLTVSPLVVPGKTQALRIFWNGSPVAAFDLSPDKETYSFDLAKDTVKDLNCMFFEFAYFDSPRRLGKSTDDRQLSVAFHKLEFLKTDESPSPVSKASEAQTADLRGRPAPAGWKGFSAPEPWGTWTDGTEATLIFRLNGPVTSDLQLIIEGKALVNEKHRQRLNVLINGKTVAQMTLSPQSPSPDPFTIPRSLVDETGVLKVTLITPDAISPKELGINQDTRRLALVVTCVVIKPIKKEEEQKH